VPDLKFFVRVFVEEIGFVVKMRFVSFKLNASETMPEINAY
jgi:hypothetical protein